MKQVNKVHYEFSKYVHKQRWISYWHQINEVSKRIKTGGKILLIGKGDGIVANILAQNGYIIDIMDFDEELEPNIIGDVRYIDDIISPASYDGIVCCQVLEHLPGEDFENVIKRINRVIKDEGIFILSLPQSNLPIRIKIDLPKIHIAISKSIACFKNKKYEFNGEHYWEVDTEGYTKKSILNILKKYFKIISEYSVFEYAYHWFVIMKKA